LTDLRTQLADLVAELVDPVEHAEPHELDPNGTEGPMRTLKLRAPYPGGGKTREIRVHRTRHPSLLDQLARAVSPSGADGWGAGGYESSPTVRLDAIDCQNAITAGIARHTTAHTDPRRALRHLVGAGDLTDAQIRRLIKDLKRWITWARIITSWDGPWRRLPTPCSECGQRGLRARVEPTVEAACTECGETWDAATVIGLTLYIEWYNAKQQHERADTGEMEPIPG
jgi:hypothetical protein